MDWKFYAAMACFSIALILAAISALPIGIIGEGKSVSEVSFQALLESNEKPILAKETNFENQFFLPRKFEIAERYIACLNDLQGVNQKEQMQIKYAQAELKDGMNNFPSIDQFFFVDYNSVSKMSVELGAGKKKQVKMFLLANQFYAKPVTAMSETQKNETLNQIEYMKRFDEIILINLEGLPKDREYYSCFDVPIDAFEKAEKIKITK